jgi:CubicO group peptidase (beta-lactamase class C family)
MFISYRLSVVLIILFSVLLTKANAFLDPCIKTDNFFISDKNDSLKTQEEQIDSFLMQLHLDGLFNGTILVAHGDKIVLEKSYGNADLSQGVVLNNEIQYQLASVSKPITAAAITILEQRGELSIEDKIGKYLPELAFYGNVRIKHLLHHTSGLQEYIYRFAKIWQADTYMGNNDLLELYAKNKFKLQFSPGSKFLYTNTNYAFLASIVERITEQDFDAFVKENIFDHLGMCNTLVFNPRKDTISCRKINSYYWDGKEHKTVSSDYRNGIMGDKGVFSTAKDLYLFMQGFHAGLLFDTETKKQTLSKFVLNNGSEVEYARGWRIRNYDGIPVFLHYGYWNSFRTGLLHFPDSKTTFVILNNITGFGKGKNINNRDLIIRQLMRISLPRKHQEEHIQDEHETENGILEGNN